MSPDIRTVTLNRMLQEAWNRDPFTSSLELIYELGDDPNDTAKVVLQLRSDLVVKTTRTSFTRDSMWVLLNKVITSEQPNLLEAFINYPEIWQNTGIRDATLEEMS